MASQKISQLTEITAIASADYFPLVQNSDTTNKRVALSSLLRSVPSGTDAAPSLAFSGDTNTGIYSPGADQVAISTNGTGRLFVDASGNVRVGTGSLTLNGYGGEGGQLEISDPTNTSAVCILDAQSATAARLFTTQANTSFQIGQLASTGGTVQLWTSGFERLRITSDGKVGLGTSSVSYKLDINNTGGGNGGFRLLSTDQSTTRIRLENTGTGGRSYEIVGGLTGVNNSTFTVYDATAAATRLAIDSSGNVGVGDTGPGDKLTVGSTADSFNAIRLQATNTGIGEIRFGDSDSANPGYIKYEHNGNNLIFAVNANERARIDSSGRLLVGTSTDSGGALLQVEGDRIRVGTAKTPASATDTGTTGEICWDANYIYVCIATNTWKRAVIATW